MEERRVIDDYMLLQCSGVGWGHKKEENKGVSS
jgi:hypothetical protein